MSEIRTVEREGRVYVNTADLGRAISGADRNSLYVPIYKARREGELPPGALLKRSNTLYMDVEHLNVLKRFMHRRTAKRMDEVLEEHGFFTDRPQVGITPFVRLMGEINSLASKRKRLEQELDTVNKRLQELTKSLDNYLK